LRAESVLEPAQSERPRHKVNEAVCFALDIYQQSRAGLGRKAQCLAPQGIHRRFNRRQGRPEIVRDHGQQLISSDYRGLRPIALGAQPGYRAA
jgi:hypothetical protein